MTRAELAERYLAWLRVSRGRSERTVEIYQHALELFFEYLGERDPREASDDDLVIYTGLWLHRRGVNANGRRPYVAAIRGFFKWGMAFDHMKRNPSSVLEYPDGGRPLPRVISLANLEKLMWAPDMSTFKGIRDAALLHLFAGCGIRVSGLVRLNQSHVVHDLVDGKPRLFLQVKEKGSKERLVPVPAEAEIQLRAYLAHPELEAIDRTLKNGDKVLFVSTHNRRCPAHEYRGERRRMQRRAVNKLILSYGKRVGVPLEQLHPHALRHLYGTELAESDVNPKITQTLMGHADPRSTAVYTHLAKRKHVTEVDRANPLAKIRTPASDLLRSIRAAGAMPSSRKAPST